MQEHRLAEETFEATRQPEGFTLALQVLSALSVLGMGIPVTLMPSFPVITMPWCGRAAVAVVFFLGVYLLLRFLFVYASYLRGDEENFAIPRPIEWTYRLLSIPSRNLTTTDVARIGSPRSASDASSQLNTEPLPARR